MIPSSFFETCCHHTNKSGLAGWLMTAQGSITPVALVKLPADYRYMEKPN